MRLDTKTTSFLLILLAILIIGLQNHKLHTCQYAAVLGQELMALEDETFACGFDTKGDECSTKKFQELADEVAILRDRFLEEAKECYPWIWNGALKQENSDVPPGFPQSFKVPITLMF